jgi:hypothetical protein
MAISFQVSSPGGHIPAFSAAGVWGYFSLIVPRYGLSAKSI